MQTTERGIDALPSGKFRVRVQLDGRPIKVPLCATFEDAVKIRDGLYAEIGAGQLVRVDGITAAQWGPAWLRKYRAHLRTKRDNRQRFEMHIAVAPWAQKAMAAVEQKELLDWWSALRQKNTQHRHDKSKVRKLSYSTRRHCRNLVHRLFADAVTEGLIRANPALGLRFPKTDADETYEQTPLEWPLNAKEQALVGELLADDPERHIVDFAMGTGLRQGEQWNLHLDDVHVDDPEAHVWVKFGSKGYSPKNRKFRRVRLFGCALDAARAWLTLLPEYAPHNPHSLMFPTPARKPVAGKRGARGGGRRTKGKVPPCWLKVKAALGRFVCWHHLRHTCATSLLCGLWGPKWNLNEIAKLLGHRSTRTTEMYAHFLEDALNEPVAQAQAAWDARGLARDVVIASSRPPNSLEKKPVSTALRSRRSEVRILCGALAFSP
jgi:integrase